MQSYDINTHNFAHLSRRPRVANSSLLTFAEWLALNAVTSQLLYALAVSRITTVKRRLSAITSICTTHCILNSRVSLLNRNWTHTRSLPSITIRSFVIHVTRHVWDWPMLNLSVIALSTQLVRFLQWDIAFGSCICFEEQFLSCDSLRPIRISKF